MSTHMNNYPLVQISRTDGRTHLFRGSVKVSLKFGIGVIVWIGGLHGVYEQRQARKVMASSRYERVHARI